MRRNTKHHLTLPADRRRGGKPYCFARRRKISTRETFGNVEKKTKNTRRTIPDARRTAKYDNTTTDRRKKPGGRVKNVFAKVKKININNIKILNVILQSQLYRTDRGAASVRQQQYYWIDWRSRITGGG